MKVGDLVRFVCSVPRDIGVVNPTGIVVEVVDADPETVPPVVKVLWRSGNIDKAWSDELELIND